jgi:hypothetical protein
VIVEREQSDFLVVKPAMQCRLGVEVVGLVAEMQPRVGRETRLRCVKRIDQTMRVLTAAQAWLP